MGYCKFRVNGQPKPQPRHRAAFKNGHVRAYDPGTAEGWKSCIAIAARPYRPATPFDGPLRISVEFIFDRPKNHYKGGKQANGLKADAPYWHTRGMGLNGGDRDNLDKAVLDAMTQLAMFKDDGQVCSGGVEKHYAVNNERTGAVITIETWM